MNDELISAPVSPKRLPFVHYATCSSVHIKSPVGRAINACKMSHKKGSLGSYIVTPSYDMPPTAFGIILGLLIEHQQLQQSHPVILCSCRPESVYGSRKLRRTLTSKPRGGTSLITDRHAVAAQAHICVFHQVDQLLLVLPRLQLHGMLLCLPAAPIFGIGLGSST